MPFILAFIGVCLGLCHAYLELYSQELLHSRDRTYDANRKITVVTIVTISSQTPCIYTHVLSLRQMSHFLLIPSSTLE